MKLAEALQERADLHRMIGQLQDRLSRNARTQEGGEPPENPQELLETLNHALDRLCVLITAINAANSITIVEGRSLTEWIAMRDVEKRRIEAYHRLVQEAGDVVSRMTRAEIVIRPAVDVSALNREADRLSKELRRIDNRIQAANWTTELPEISAQ